MGKTAHRGADIEKMLPVQLSRVAVARSGPHTHAEARLLSTTFKVAWRHELWLVADNEALAFASAPPTKERVDWELWWRTIRCLLRVISVCSGVLRPYAIAKLFSATVESRVIVSRCCMYCLLGRWSVGSLRDIHALLALNVVSGFIVGVVCSVDVTASLVRRSTLIG